MSVFRRGAPAAALIFIFFAASVRAQSQPGGISFEANVRVTSDIAMAHTESAVAVDSLDSRNVLGATTVFANLSGAVYNKTYASHDGGHTWEDTTPPGARIVTSGDPRAAFTERGTALFVSLNLSGRRTEIYRSTDGGANWRGPAHFQLLDHELVGIDRTHGRYENRIYIAAEGGKRDKHAPPAIGEDRIIYLYTSDDDGRTFQLRSEPETGLIGAGQTFNYGGVGVTGLVVLRDGTVALSFARYKPPTVGYEANYVATSTDGGKTFGKPVWVSNWYRFGRNEAEFMRAETNAEHAGDVTGQGETFALGAYGERLYAVWRGSRASAGRIVFSYSANRGATWSAPRYVDAAGRSGTQFQAEVATDDRGAVAVAWFGTAGFPKRDHFNAYVAVSTDGGRTFSLPARVSSHASFPRTPGNLQAVPFYEREIGYGFISAYSRWGAGGDYIGLAAGNDGVFHLYWPDARGKEYEVYSACIRASGPAQPPSSAVAHDVSSDTMLSFDPVTIDVVRHEIDIPIRLRNASKHTLYGPISVEFLGLQSAIMRRNLGLTAPSAQILNATSGGTGYGATFDYSNTLGTYAALPPSGVSDAIVWRLRVSDIENLSPIALNLRVTARY